MMLRRSTAVFAVLLTLLSASAAHAEWFKGNTHCHTNASPDSETPQDALMAWYKGHDYDFVVLTDHNNYTNIQTLNALSAFDAVLGREAPLVDETFILIPGEELTTNAHHVNGIDMPERYDPGSTIAASFEVVWAAGGLPQLNHPEWNYLTARDIIEEIAELQGPMFIEVYNSHGSVVERSGPSSEDIWDGILASGRQIWGVAVDDAHTLEDGGTPPGGGFIYVDAEELTIEAITQAMAAGRLYASSGATLEDFAWTSNLYEVDAPGATEIIFFGAGGQVLERVEGDYASYVFRDGDQYVRARVESPEGFAWTQPLFLDERPTNIPPEAVIAASVEAGEAPLRVQFDGRGSSDPDGVVESWRWDFGDGATGRGEVIAHTFDDVGQYEVELVVFDDDVEMSRDTVVIRVREPAPVGMSNGTTGGSNGTTAGTTGDSGDGETGDGMVNNPGPVAQASSGDDGCTLAGTTRRSGPLGWVVALSFLLCAGWRRRR